MAQDSSQWEADLVRSVPTQLFVGGNWQDAEAGATFAVEDPSTGEVLTRVADASAGDAVAALERAHGAQRQWRECPPRTRGELLRAAFAAITRKADDLARLMTLEMGKPVAESRAEVAYGAEFFRWFSEEAVRIDGRYTAEPTGQGHLLVTSQPVGPSYAITPWNFPLAMATRKIGAALAAGCTVIAKPSELTPLSLLALARILEEVGVPPGVVNVIPTTRAAEVTAPLLSDVRLRKLSFTGSTAVGRSLAALAAPNLLRVSLELGGNAPFLVFEDADVDAAVEGAMLAKLRNMGEACTSANRFLVHEAVLERFAVALTERMSTLHVGRGTDPDTQVGPLISETARTKVSDLVDDAVSRGATVATGGHPVQDRGYFYAPTVLTDVAPDARLCSTEIFGPVAPIVAFSTDVEAVSAANATEYGLVAYVYTRDMRRAFTVCDALDAGMVGLNRGLVSNPAAPFGGVKQSGYGREGGAEGIWEYRDVKYIAIDV